MENKSAVTSIIQEMYEIAGDLGISADKSTQARGKQLRQLIEQIESYFSQELKPPSES